MPYAAMRRVPARPTRRGAQKFKHKSFPAPIRGWIANENLAKSKPGGALRLDNWFPTQTGIRLRGGNRKHATIGSNPVETLFTYRSGGNQKFFAADAGNIFNISSPASPTVAPTADVTGRTSGYYSTAPFTTAAGDFLYALNGTDAPLLYDNTFFYPITNQQIFGIAYDAETAPFAQTGTLTGATSGATATIVKAIDNGSTGVVWIRGITGTFQDNEIIFGSVAGQADANIPAGVTSVQTVTITNVTSSLLSQAWTYRNRLFFVEKSTMRFWYPAVNQLGGALTSFTLAGVFTKGGSLLFGATWSLDAGDGVDDKCVFVSTEGQAAIYEGDNPSDANAWRLVGVYDISKPLGKNAWARVGGDLIIETDEGIVPISLAIGKDEAALSLSAISRQIEPAWKAAARARKARPWEFLKWAEFNMGIVNVPRFSASDTPMCFVVNLETGAWARYTGWDTRCLGLFNEWAYFGCNDGTIRQAEIGGNDNGAPYECVAVGLFSDLGSPGVTKFVHQGRANFIASSPFNPLFSVSVNYGIQLPVAPNSVANYSEDVWDVGLWDVMLWDAVSDPLPRSTGWVSIGKTGHTIAPQLQITCGVTPYPRVELITDHVTYETGGLVV